MRERSLSVWRLRGVHPRTLDYMWYDFTRGVAALHRWVDSLRLMDMFIDITE